MIKVPKTDDLVNTPGQRNGTAIEISPGSGMRRISPLERPHRRHAARQTEKFREQSTRDGSDTDLIITGASESFEDLEDDGIDPVEENVESPHPNGRGGNPDATPTPTSLFNDVVDKPSKSRSPQRSGKRLPHDDLLTEKDEPQFLSANPYVIRAAGGGCAALVLAGIVYWITPAKDGIPRWRPQPNPHRPSCGPGYFSLAHLLGLVTSSRKRAESQMKRAIDWLVGKSLVESFSFVDEPPDPYYSDWPATLADQRHRNRRWFRLTPEFAARLETEMSSQQQEYDCTLSVKVWRADVRQLDVNQAILLGQLWYRCVDPGNGMCAQRYGRKWLPRSYQDLDRETGLTVDQVRTAADKLQRRGFICAESFRFKGRRIRHYRINKKARDVIQRWRGEYCQRSPENHG